MKKHFVANTQEALNSACDGTEHKRFVTNETEKGHVWGVWTVTLSGNRSRCSNKLLMLHCQPHEVTATGHMINVDRWQCLSAAQH